MFSISDTGITGYAHIKERELGKEGEEKGEEKTGKRKSRKRGKAGKRICTAVSCNMEKLTKRDQRINHEINVNF